MLPPLKGSYLKEPTLPSLETVLIFKKLRHPQQVRMFSNKDDHITDLKTCPIQFSKRCIAPFNASTETP